MNEKIMKYKYEIDFIRNNYNVDKSDLIIAEEIDLFMNKISGLYDYSFEKHILALADVIVNSQNVEEDGLTPKAKSILGAPKMRILDLNDLGL